jgi:uncharacterized protein (TIGR02271 family)
MFIQSDIRTGMVVKSSDGEKLGKVIRCDADAFLIEKGLFFPKDYIARYDQIAAVEQDEVRLAVTAASFRDLGTAYEGPTATRQPEATGLRAGAEEELRVPLAEEELVAEKRTREAGEVKIHKDVVTERREIPVELTREEVHVERAPVAPGDARGGEATFEGGTVSVPIREEEVEIRKRPVVREEVRVTKTARREEQRAGAEVRRETVDIEKEGDVESRKPGSFDDPRE